MRYFHQGYNPARKKNWYEMCSCSPRDLASRSFRLRTPAPRALFALRPPDTADPDLRLVASFEGGQRYLAGSYPVIVLNGSFR